MKYRLTAQNDTGASVTYTGNTMKQCIEKFDAEYARKGFKIEIIDNLNGGTLRIVKRGYR